MNLDGFYIIHAEPMGPVKRKQHRTPGSRGRLPSVKEVEVPGLGKRLVRFGDTGYCNKWDNCFTCPHPIEECTGGEYSNEVRKRLKVSPIPPSKEKNGTEKNRI